ncbi:MAG: hypothetical protein Q7J04_00445 [Microcella sp.]|nr:hypothetical protein [Microcella sp.]
MSSTILTINSQRIPLEDDADVRSLITDVMSAVMDGGGFVHIDGKNGEEYEVLVSAATPVMVRHGTMAFESGSTGGPWTSGIDLDM